MPEPKVVHLPAGAGSGLAVEKAEPPIAGVPVSPLAGFTATGLVPPLGWVRFQDVDDARQAIVCRLNGDSPSPGIAPGWEKQARPGRTAITHWPGRDPLELPIGLLFRDEFRQSVEAEVAMLEVLAGRDVNPASTSPPPVVQFDTGGLSPFDVQHHPGLRWVISDLQRDRAQDRRNGAGECFYASLTAVLWLQVDDQVVEERSAALRRERKGKLVYPKRYTVKAGDTLVSIAKRQLGDAGRWHEIAALNDLRDPHAALKAGRKLRLR